MLFLVTQTLLFLGLAFAFGVYVGWMVWGRLQIEPIEFKPKSGSEQPAGSVSVLSDSLLKTQRELETCQQSLADAETRLQEMELRFPKKNSQAKSQPEKLKSNLNATGERDDLKLIFGIGPLIERKLAEIDVTTYRQIAFMTDEEIMELGEYLNYFPGRIERDGWQSSARELHEEKYGEKI
jgi:predicted flap endonuclease-1-like 5' DNA nuclease